MKTGSEQISVTASQLSSLLAPRKETTPTPLLIIHSYSQFPRNWPWSQDLIFFWKENPYLSVWEVPASIHVWGLIPSTVGSLVWNKIFMSRSCGEEWWNRTWVMVHYREPGAYSQFQAGWLPLLSMPHLWNGISVFQSSVDIVETAWALPSDWPVSKSLNDLAIFSKAESVWVLSCKGKGPASEWFYWRQICWRDIEKLIEFPGCLGN